MDKNRLFKIIKEGVQKEITRQYISNVVREELLRLEEKDDKHNSMKRKSVMSSLKDPKFNHAQLAYSLYKPKDKSEKDTVRSLFSKKATGNEDANGVVRQFSDKEINKLYQMIRTK